MSDAEKLFRLDCRTTNSIIAVAKVALLMNKEVLITGEGMWSRWLIFENKWAARESKYRINLYDETGTFVQAVYDWFEAVAVIVVESHERHQEK